MKITPLAIPELLLIEPRAHGDDRGYFMESFRRDLLSEALGRTVDFIQDNESLSSRGVLRGLHYQLPPFAQSKLVRVVRGAILDVAVDIRRGSPHFGQHLALELSDSNKQQLFVPRGFAHGFVVLSDEAIVQYKVDNGYAPEQDRGIRFDDPALGIDWRLSASELLLSAKDREHPLLAEATDLFQYGDTRL